MKIDGSNVDRLSWFKHDRFGMFIHWGLYSASDLDCWVMHDMGIPADEYFKRYEPGFTGDKFDADELAKLAKAAGCKYMVMGARHHEGYCLWDSSTTELTSVKRLPKRDFIAEYVEAARRHGLKIGIYYSLLDWTDSAYWDGPRRDPAGWARMIKKVFSQIKELMTQYGKIDILWYDGGWHPRTGYWGYSPAEPHEMALFRGEGLAKVWDSVRLNKMVRDSQPEILINNRAYTAEDFGTPEQTLVPEERAWEFCDTMGDLWGYSSVDLNRKSPRQLIHNLIKCVSLGGNLLLNIGPKADGSVASWQRDNLESIGQWMAVHSESIYGCGEEPRRPYFSDLSPWRATRKENVIYLHLFRYPGKEFGLARFHGDRILSARLLSSDLSLGIRREPTRDVIFGLPESAPDRYAPVVKLDISDESEEWSRVRANVSLR